MDTGWNIKDQPMMPGSKGVDYMGHPACIDCAARDGTIKEAYCFKGSVGWLCKQHYDQRVERDRAQIH